MKYNKFWAALGVVMFMGSCDTEKDMALYQNDPKAIRICATINTSYTRTNPTGEDQMQRHFNSGDVICLGCEDGSMDFAYDGEAWNPTDYYYFVWNPSTKVYNAHYPVSAGTDVNNFTLPANQQTPDGLAKSDYMVCTVENAEDDGSHILNLPMRRMMAKVVIILSDVDSESKVQGLRIGSRQGYKNGEAMKETTLVSPYMEIPDGVQAGQNGVRYTAIVTPGAANDEATYISMNYRGDDITLPGIPEMEAGKCYEYQLKAESGMISLGDPVVLPWNEGSTLGGTAAELHYYVRNEAAGNGSGLDWDNAMGFSDFKSMVCKKGDNEVSDADARLIDGQVFYFAGGEYEMLSGNQGLEIGYDHIGRQISWRIEGGYNPASKGTDISDRDTGRYPTIFTKDKDSSGSSTGDALLRVGNNSNILIDGVTFDGKSTHEGSGKIRAIYVCCDGQSSMGVLCMENCNISNFNTAGLGDSGGGAIKIERGEAYLDKVSSTGHASKSRGGAYQLASDKINRLFMNNCFMADNVAPGGWGTAIHARGGNICINNTTVVAAKGAGGSNVAVNGDGSFIVSNSTFIASPGNPNGVFRSGKVTSLLINSLFVLGEGERTISKYRIQSGGFNVYQGAESGWGAIETDTDYSLVEMPVSLSDGLLEWTPGDAVKAFATQMTVVNAVRSFSDAGADFVKWLGEEEFGRDSRGRNRNADKMQPGSYDKGL